MTTTSGGLMATDTEQYFRDGERHLAGSSNLLGFGHFCLTALIRVEFYAQHVVHSELTACLEALQQLAAGDHATAVKKLVNTQSSFITMTEAAARIDAGEISMAEAMIAFHAARIFAGVV